MRDLRLSATANADYLACQRRYQLSYIYDLTKEADKDSTRIGGNWHGCHEMLELPGNTVCPECKRHEEIRSGCWLCYGTGHTPTDPMETVARYLHKAYAIVPDNKTREDWEVERVTLLYSLAGHRWLYEEEEGRWEILGSEIKFEVPVINTRSKKHRRLAKAVFVGKIDRLVRDRTTGLVYVWERKSTGMPITNESYWQGLTQGDQVSGYIYGGRIAQLDGQLEAFGLKPTDPLIAGAWCDVWHKPDIAPKRVSKADLKALAETGLYCGTQVEAPTETPDGNMIETPEMFGARLLTDIAERPQHYFAQREVSRTDADLKQFQVRLYGIAKQIRTVERIGCWLCNLQACEAKWRCEFLDLCRSGVAVNKDTVPAGYKKKHPVEVEEEIILE